MYVITAYLPWKQVVFYTSVAPKITEAQSAWLVPGTYDEDGKPLPQYVHVMIDEEFD